MAHEHNTDNKLPSTSCTPSLSEMMIHSKPSTLQKTNCDYLLLEIGGWHVQRTWTTSSHWALVWNMGIRFWRLVQTDRDRAFQCGIIVCRSEPMVPTLSTPTQTSSFAKTTLVTETQPPVQPVRHFSTDWFFFSRDTMKLWASHIPEGGCLATFAAHETIFVPCVWDNDVFFRLLTVPLTNYTSHCLFFSIACMCRMLKPINHWILFLIIM